MARSHHRRNTPTRFHGRPTFDVQEDRATRQSTIYRIGYEIHVLPLALLNVASSHDEPGQYQRDTRGRWVKWLTENWDDDKYEPIVASRRQDGTYWITNGQHRREALLLLGYTDAECLVRSSAAVEEEAARYTSQASTVRITSIDMFRAKLIERDPAAMAVDTAVRATGFQVAMGSGLDRLQCVETLMTIHRQAGRDGISQTVTLVRDTWPTEQRVRTASWLTAVFQFLTYHRYEYDRATFVRKVGGLPFSSLEERANAHRIAYGSGSNSTPGYRALLQTYNERMRTNLLIDRVGTIVANNRVGQTVWMAVNDQEGD